MEKNTGGNSDGFRIRPESIIQKLGVYPMPVMGESVPIPDQSKVRQTELEMKNEHLRLAQAELANSRAQYRDLYDLAPIGFLNVESDGKIRQANMAAAKILGLHAEELVSQDFSHFIRSEDQGEFYFRRQRLRATKATQTCDLQLTRADGSWIWVDLTIRSAPGKDVDSEVLISMADITCRRLVEATLLLKSSALEAAANSIFITNRDGRIEWANAAFSSLSGFTKEEIIGRSPNEITSSGSQNEVSNKMLWQTILGGNVWHGEIINRRKDGSHYIVDMTITPVYGESGQTPYFIGVCQDISERKALREQLLQAQKMEAVGQLACGVAHDFNNILAIIMMQAEATEMGENVSGETRDGLSQIRAAASRASDLVKQLLAFGRIPTDRQDCADVDLVICELAHMLRPALGETIHLDLDLHSSSLRVSADSSTLDQLVTNLVINARDAMPDGGSIHIETSDRNFSAEEAALILNVKAGPYVQLSVSDNGTGMEPEIIAKIFEPFFTTKEPGKGTGLGLSTVYAIVQQQGGSVQVKSQPGRGTCFRILLPACERTTGSAAVEYRKPDLSRGAETILLVEDQPALRELMATVLGRQGYQVLSAGSGEDALKIWENFAGDIHLLLTDLMMAEGISGQGLANQLLERSPQLPILFSSACVPEFAQNHALLPARQAFMQKPVCLTDLLDTIRELIDG